MFDKYYSNNLVVKFNLIKLYMNIKIKSQNQTVHESEKKSQSSSLFQQLVHEKSCFVLHSHETLSVK